MTQTGDPLRRKALACIREGRVSVLRTICPDAVTTWKAVRPTGVLARVVSGRDGHPYRVEHHNGKWSCDCREGRRDLPCAQSAALADAGYDVWFVDTAPLLFGVAS